MNAYELADLLHKNAGDGNTPIRQAANMLRQLAEDKDNVLMVLKEVDGVLLDYIEQLEKKPMTTLAHGREVASSVKYMIAILEDGK